MIKFIVLIFFLLTTVCSLAQKNDLKFYGIKKQSFKENITSFPAELFPEIFGIYYGKIEGTGFNIEDTEKKTIYVDLRVKIEINDIGFISYDLYEGEKAIFGFTEKINNIYFDKELNSFFCGIFLNDLVNNFSSNLKIDLQNIKEEILMISGSLMSYKKSELRKNVHYSGRVLKEN